MPDLDHVVTAMIKLAGLPVKHYDQATHQAFLEQAKEFEELDYDALNAAVKFLAIANKTHPWTVMRAAELLRWVEGGDYEQVLARKSAGRVHKRTEGRSTYCRNCGHHFKGSEKFCPTCGQQL